MTNFIQETEFKKQVGTKGNKQGLAIFITLLLLIITLSTACAYYAIQYHALKNELAEVTSQAIILEEPEPEIVEEPIEEVDERGELLDHIKSTMIDGSTTVAMLREIFEDDIVFVDGEGYNFYPIDEDLPKHNYEDDNFIVNENGRIEYVVDGEVISKTGIDLARFQGNVDWEKVAADGIDFAIIRVGARGYETGAMILDEQFHNNIQGAIDAGVEIGVYFYTQAISEEEAIEEATLVITELADYKEYVTWPVVIDVEDPDWEGARTNELTQEERTDYTIAFLDVVEAEGYEPMIYGNMKSFLKMLDMYRIGEYEKWYANYNEKVYFPYELTIWQYTDSGEVDGINTAVDMNIAFR